MKLVLSNKGSNKELIVESDNVFFEADDDGVSTHVVFSAQMVRVVNESMASIAAALGVIAPKASVAPSAMAVAMKPVKKALKK